MRKRLRAWWRRREGVVEELGTARAAAVEGVEAAVRGMR
jgi:hypothetical protein